MTSLAIQVITGRWFMVFGCLLIMAMAGATYMFGIYSEVIKTQLGYDQTTLNLLSFSKDLGSNIGIISGLINEVAPPWITLSIGAVLNFFGYFMIWLAVEGRIPKPKVWQMCLYIGIGANSQAFANTGSLVPCVMNFPESRGVVLGLLKGFVGLSGAIITQVYHAVYGEDAESLILMIGWLPTAVSFIFLRTIRLIKVERNPNELKIFYRLLYTSLGLAGFLLVIIIAQKLVRFSRLAYSLSAFMVALLLFLPVVIAFLEEKKAYESKKLEIASEPPKLQVVTEPASPQGIVAEVPRKAVKHTGCFENVFSPPARGEDYTILQAMCSMDMAILMLATACGIGGTLTAIDNLGQIGASLGYPKRSISIFVSLVSIWSFLGRVFAGFVSEHLLKKHNFPRPLMMTITLIFVCAGYLMVAFHIPYGLYPASIIIGFSFGAQWPLLFAMISELFGLKYYSTLYNFGTVASPIGSYVLNVEITGYLYDKEAHRKLVASGLVRKAGEALHCHGGMCFKLSFIIITLATLFGALMAGVLAIRTRKFYSSDIYKKFRDEETLPESQMAEDNGHFRSSQAPTSAGRTLL